MPSSIFCIPFTNFIVYIIKYNSLIILSSQIHIVCQHYIVKFLTGASASIAPVWIRPWMKSSNFGLEPDTKVLPASLVHLALKKTGSFRLSSLRVFIWFKSLRYSGPIPFSVRLVESRFLVGSSNDNLMIYGHQYV